MDYTFDAIIDSGCLDGLPAKHWSQYLRSILGWSHSKTKFILLVQCKDHPPADWLSQVETFFTPHFVISSYEHRANVLPRAPELTMMVFRLIRYL
jgi:hypothetical protein